ncbi:serine/threonine-protein kinase [Kitasatospora sp. CB01950]|uniref:serine/threonine-protein kinase n=1 Tax=Kitasatospora sp. CB01950 TaxID=1703930 RepID=UPI00093D76C5|nr:serine/threonine-protein kinase [Kitasatospora sp. CB01950]
MTSTAGDLVGGRYRLVETIGEGGMGRVWRGRDDLLQRDVAIKELTVPGNLTAHERDRLVVRVIREARAAARLSHPGIVTVHDVVQHRGAPMIVMELVRGRSLSAVLRDEGPLAGERVAAIGTAVADALAVAHAEGIVHRDLKPDNILIDGNRVVVTDFGIASMADATMLTSEGVVLGTPAYMSPEQIEGRHLTTATDLWSLGVTLYVAVEGELPFSAPSLGSLFAAVLTQEPRPAHRAGALWPGLSALLRKDPVERAAAEQVAGLLQADEAVMRKELLTRVATTANAMVELRRARSVQRRAKAPEQRSAGSPEPDADTDAPVTPAEVSPERPLTPDEVSWAAVAAIAGLGILTGLFIWRLNTPDAPAAFLWILALFGLFGSGIVGRGLEDVLRSWRSNSDAKWMGRIIHGITFAIFLILILRSKH